MIELHTWGTTNGRRPIIFLEEAGLPYKIVPVDIQHGANKTPQHLALSPLGKIPAMIDTDGPGGQKVKLFESAAILLYLAEKTDKFYGSTPLKRAAVQKWLIFNVANVLPTFSIMRGSCADSWIRRTSALPTMTPSATAAIRAASSGVATPKPTAIGTRDCFRISPTLFPTSATSRNCAPVMPVSDT